MSKQIVVITVPTHAETLARLRQLADVEIRFAEEPSSPVDEVVDWHDEQFRHAHAMFCSGYAPRNIGEMKSLRWVQIGSAGFEQWMKLDLPSRGIRLSNALGVFDTPIAEWNIAMMVNLLRDLRSMIRNQEAGHWDGAARFQRDVRGLTVGLWGYGGIGRETARLAKTMGMRVHVLVRGGAVKSRSREYVVKGTGDPEGTLPDRVFDSNSSQQKAEFLRSLNFLILAMPLTPTTRGIVGEEELRSLPRDAYLLNPARGPIVQEAALLKALRENWIAGAALDTHYYYPMPPEHPLWKMPNVIMTPHISGSGGTPSYSARVWDVFAQNLDRYLNGRPLLNEVTAQQLRG